MPLLDTFAGCETADTDKGTMGLSWGMEDLNPRKKNRWMFRIPSVCADSVPAMPPKRAARPGLQFKEFEFQHLSESIWYPLKAEWKPINITLYDVRCTGSTTNAVFNWLKRIYDTTQDEESFTFRKALDSSSGGNPFKIPEAALELYDGCGNILESWVFENVYPSTIDWGELDMTSGDLVTVDFTLRYDRARMG